MPFLDLVRWKISTKYNFRTILLPDGRFQKGWGSVDNDIDVEPNEKLHISFHQSTDVSDSTSDNALSAQYNAGGRHPVQPGLLLHRHQPPAGAPEGDPDWEASSASGATRCGWNSPPTTTSPRGGFATSQVALAYVQPCVAESMRYSHVAIKAPNALTKEDRIDLVITLRSLGDLSQSGSSPGRAYQWNHPDQLRSAVPLASKTGALASRSEEMSTPRVLRLRLRQLGQRRYVPFNGRKLAYSVPGSTSMRLRPLRLAR